MINLQIDTKVYVKYNKSDDWELRTFIGWGHNGNILCCGDADTTKDYRAGRWESWSYWRIAEGKYKGINNEEKRLTEGRSNLAVFCLILGSSSLVVNAIAKYLSYIPKDYFLHDFLGICSLTIVILIMLFGKK